MTYHHVEKCTEDDVLVEGQSSPNTLWTNPATLTPLKTTLELRTETSLIDFYVVKVPVTFANKSLE
jgi:hypothetical protein